MVLVLFFSFITQALWWTAGMLHLPLCLRGWNWELRELPCCHATCPLCKLKWAWRRIKKKNILFQSRDSFSIDLCCVWGLCGLTAGINLFVIQVMKKKMKKKKERAQMRDFSSAQITHHCPYSLIGPAISSDPGPTQVQGTSKPLDSLVFGAVGWSFFSLLWWSWF